MMTTTAPVTGERRAGEIQQQLAAAREEQVVWVARGLHERLRALKHLRHLLAEQAEDLAAQVGTAVPARAHPGETLASEVLPLLDAIRFIERRGPALLLPRALGRRGLPMWLTGVTSQVQRAPWGVVLVIGPGNYPLLLTVAPALAAIAAGNAALLKPAPGCGGLMRRVVELAASAGVARELLPVLDEDKASAEAAIDAGVDHVVLTGSVPTGQAVLERCARTLTPTTMELSGCDLLVVREDADLSMAARAVTMGLRLNGGQTCMAPRRLMVHRAVAADFQERLLARVGQLRPVPVSEATGRQLAELIREAETGGASVLCGGLSDEGVKPMVLGGVTAAMSIAQADVFAPVCSLMVVADDDAVIAADAACPYGLTAAIFGHAAAARDLAERLDVGVVQINELFAGTVDPRVPFGGARQSGFGVTRGAEGLLGMTRPKVVQARRGRFRPHYDAMDEATADLVRGYLKMAHRRGWRRRLTALRTMVSAGRRRWAQRR
jgi:acyl-CoA reductase-like NAD-dependent aldehyde dehydrogenase